MFANLLEVFSLSKANTDKKAQIGIGALPDLMITIGVVAVIAVIMLIVLATLGANDAVSSDTDVQEIINNSKDAIKAPFDLISLLGTIFILIVILGLVFLIYKARSSPQ
jgi:hypothetical protein